MPITLLQLSSLEKVQLSEKPQAAELTAATVLSNERFSYQIAYFADPSSYAEKAALGDFHITVSSGLSAYITVRKVHNIPVELAAYPDPENSDDDYITHSPALLPDILAPVEREKLIPHRWHSFWITVDLDGTAKPGIYPIDLCFRVGENTYIKSLQLEILPLSLPKQDLIFTQWFYCDCLASYYHIPVFSEAHWRCIDSFMQTAVRNGINMLLTPIFTPPLDTEVGGERPTVQLVGVTKTETGYEFDFSLLRRWVALCRKNGVEYFEMAHLFTQWGAKAAPKILATLPNGEEKRIFGWDTPADAPAYKAFLDAFLPQLVSFLKDEGIAEKTVFHISDEPDGDAHRESYKTAKELVKKHLAGFKLMDALSHVAFYQEGLVENPIPATNAIGPFLALDIPDLWTYYCCGQGKDVGNRFVAMPSYRNRILADQLFKYRIAGFLQWGYNSYYSQLARRTVNPYVTTDADGAFPAGDAFSVYPAGDGTALESLRLCVFYDALQDLRAMQLLARHIGHGAVVALLEQEAGQTIEFDSYPRSAEYLLRRREKINQKLREVFGV